MRLDFNVMWIEDHPDNVQSQCERIALQIKKEGFRFVTKFSSNITEAKSYFHDEIYGDHIDLVLMDYDLGGGEKGDSGLVEVRRLFPYKDIVFYSSQAQDLKQMVADKQVQGIFCSTREDLTDTVEGIFEALVKKVLDIDHSRGIVMGATSEIDYHVNNCLISSFDQHDQTNQRGMIEAIVDTYRAKERRSKENLQEILEISHVQEIINNLSFTSSDRIILLIKLLQAKSSQERAVQLITEYKDNVIPKRNDLAHFRVKTTGFSRKLFNRKGDELTSDKMRLLRQELLKHQEHFEALSGQLDPQKIEDE